VVGRLRVTLYTNIENWMKVKSSEVYVRMFRGIDGRWECVEMDINALLYLTYMVHTHAYFYSCLGDIIDTHLICIMVLHTYGTGLDDDITRARTLYVIT
jgi:hypothetical protein